jgi:hypothetical protein
MLCLVLAACGSRSSEPGGLIVRAGTFPSPDGKYTLTVTVESNADVSWSLGDAATANVRASGGGFSDSQRWFFLWDDTGRLWMGNSDMGPLEVRRPDAHGNFTAQEIRADSPELKSMPSEVRAWLGSVHRKQLKLDVGSSPKSP